MRQLARIFDERGRISDLDPIAVIDIGSNSVRLVVYEGAVRAATPLFNEKVLCGLGRGLAATGRLDETAFERSLKALRRFRSIITILGIKKVMAIATAAVRDAQNGPDFIARGREACGTTIEILSGGQEAELAAHGIMMGFVRPNGLVGDLGGGSLELIDLAEGKRKHAITAPVGGLRLMEAAEGRPDKVGRLVDEHIDRIDWLGLGEGRDFFAVGGTWRAIAKIHMAFSDYPLRIMQGYSIAADEAIEFCEAMRKSKRLSLLPGVDSISKARREVIPYGAVVLERLMRAIKPRQVVFSVFGIREGLLFKAMSREERGRDPLISFCLELARQRSRSVDHAHELCLWTDAIFQAPGPDENEDERRLRHAACLISDIGWRAHPDYRGEQSLNIVAHAGLTGIDHAGRIFLALSIYFRHNDRGSNGTNPLSERLQAAVGRHAMKRARIVGAAVRAAHMLSVGVPGVIKQTPLSYEGDKLVLTIPKKLAGLEGERLSRRFDSLARLLDREGEIRVG